MDLHSMKAPRIAKSKGLLKRAGYADGGKITPADYRRVPSGGHEAESGDTDGLADGAPQKRKSGGRATGKKSAKRLDRAPRGKARKKRANGGETDGDDDIREMNSPKARMPDKDDPEFTGEELDKIDSEAHEKAATDKPIGQSFGPKEDNAIGMAAHSNFRGFMNQIGKGKSLEAARDAGDALGEHAYRQAGGDSAGSSWRKAAAGETKKRGGRA